MQQTNVKIYARQYICTVVHEKINTCIKNTQQTFSQHQKIKKQYIHFTHGKKIL